MGIRRVAPKRPTIELIWNTVLTVEKDKANSHKDIGWEIFTDFVIKQINDKLDNVVFILWGRQARDKKRIITIIIETITLIMETRMARAVRIDHSHSQSQNQRKKRLRLLQFRIILQSRNWLIR